MPRGPSVSGSVDDPVPHGLSLAHQKVVDLARHSVGVMAEAARNPLSEGGEKSQRPGYQSGQGFQFGVQTETGFAYHLEDEDEEDRESVADPPLQDRTYARLIDFIYNRFAHSQPSASANAPSRCEFEDLFRQNTYLQNKKHSCSSASLSHHFRRSHSIIIYLLWLQIRWCLFCPSSVPWGSTTRVFSGPCVKLCR